MVSHLQPEQQVLLHLAAPKQSAAGRSLLGKLFARPLDWHEIVALGRRHKVSPLLFWNLRSFPPQAVPPWVLEQLGSVFSHTARQTLLLSRELHRLNAAFGKKEIENISFKGPLLGELAFGNLALRQSGDLDILVRKSEVGRAKKVVVAEGYRPSELRVPGRKRMLNPEGPAEKAFLRSHYHYVFFHQETGVRLELHWAFDPHHYFSPLESPELWQRAVRRTIGGAEYLSLGMEDLILALCIHGTRHQWEQLRWVCDLAGLANLRQDVDWQRVLHHARSLGGERMILAGFRCAHDYLGAELPTPLAARIACDKATRGLAEKAASQWFIGSKRPDEGPPQPLLSPYQILSRERLRDKVRFCSRFLATPTVNDWDSSHLPRLSSGCYYVVRPLRLAAEYLSRSLKRINSRPDPVSKASRPAHLCQSQQGSE